MPISFELASAVLSFLGGGLLSVDALRARQRIRAENGAKAFLKIMNAHSAGDLITDERGGQLSSESALQLWLSRQSTKWAWFGFVLMTFGFVLQILAALTKAQG